MNKLSDEKRESLRNRQLELMCYRLRLLNIMGVIGMNRETYNPYRICTKRIDRIERYLERDE